MVAPVAGGSFFFLSVVPFGLGHFLPWLLWLVGSFLQWPAWVVELFLPWPHVADGVTFTVALWVVGSFLLWLPCLLRSFLLTAFQDFIWKLTVTQGM